MAKVILVRVRRNEAIVRKYMFDEHGRVVAKYGLTVPGEWLKVPEGEAYPDECRLAVSWLDWVVPAGQEIKRALRKWLLDRGGELELLWARWKSFCRRQRRRWLWARRAENEHSGNQD